eukprot:COSAG01_NODE_57975_length_309_cov_0.533333_1_plen_36_part_01
MLRMGIERWGVIELAILCIAGDSLALKKHALLVHSI